MTDDDPQPATAWYVDPSHLTRLLLLPWTGADGKPAYLSGGSGLLSRVADALEELQLAAAERLLDVAPAVLDNPTAAPDELRFTARELASALTAAVRVAQSRARTG
jgi:hypothetical protein